MSSIIGGPSRLEIASQAVSPQVGMVPTHAIAVTPNVQHGGVVQEAVDDSRSDHWLVEDLAPVAEAAVGLRMTEPRS